MPVTSYLILAQTRIRASPCMLLSDVCFHESWVCFSESWVDKVHVS